MVFIKGRQHYHATLNEYVVQKVQIEDQKELVPCIELAWNACAM